MIKITRSEVANHKYDGFGYLICGPIPDGVSDVEEFIARQAKEKGDYMNLRYAVNMYDKPKVSRRENDQAYPVIIGTYWLLCTKS